MINNTTIFKEILKEELEMLKKKSGINTNFEILLIPKADSTKEGEVIGNKIYIYSTNLKDAIETLRHEFFDVMVSNALNPYLDLVNALLLVISERAYKRKEKVVESLVGILRHSDPVFSGGKFSSEKNLATV